MRERELPGAFSLAVVGVVTDSSVHCTNPTMDGLEIIGGPDPRRLRVALDSLPVNYPNKGIMESFRTRFERKGKRKKRAKKIDNRGWTDGN